MGREEGQGEGVKFTCNKLSLIRLGTGFLEMDLSEIRKWMTDLFKCLFFTEIMNLPLLVSISAYCTLLLARVKIIIDDTIHSMQVGFGKERSL